MSSGIGIGNLAARAGINPSAVRYYEAEGLLPKAGRRSGRRVYGSDDLVRLRLIVSARELGFSISDLRAMSNLNASELKAEARTRAAQLRSSIAQLSRLADEIEDLAGCGCNEPSQCAILPKA